MVATPRFTVAPEEVHAVASTAQQAASTLQSAASAMTAPAVDSPGFTTAEAVSSLTTGWQQALTSMQRGAAAVSSALASTATTYEVIEAHVRGGWAE